MLLPLICALIINICYGEIFNCICVPYYQCAEETGSIITDGKGLLDLRGYNKTICTGYFDVCCNVTDKIITDESSFPQNTGCGYKLEKDNTWTGFLTLKIRSNNKSLPKYRCGVSLIHQQVALTAAHCFGFDKTQWIIKSGSLEREILKVIIHPNYNSGSLQNDIAILIMKHTDDRGLKVICLPPPEVAVENEKCLLKLSKRKNAILPVLPNNKCQDLLQSTRLGPHFKLHPSFLCTGSRDVHNCEGIGGNPLICPIPSKANTFYQIGIVSWGLGCEETNSPSVYVNLAMFRDWIDLVMTENNFNVNSYTY